MFLSHAGPEREEALRGSPAGGAKDDPRCLRATPGGTKLSNAALSRQLAPCTPRAWQPFGSRDGPEAREAAGSAGLSPPPVREEPPALRWGEGSALWPSFRIPRKETSAGASAVAPPPLPGLPLGHLHEGGPWLQAGRSPRKRGSPCGALCGPGRGSGAVCKLSCGTSLGLTAAFWQSLMASTFYSSVGNV